METRRFLNPSHPQALQSATFLLYFNAVFGIIGFLVSRDPIHSTFEVISILGGLAGYGIANDKTWGYYGGLVTGILRALYAILLVWSYGPGLSAILGVVFPLLVVYLLLHQTSRDYKRIWFK